LSGGQIGKASDEAAALTARYPNVSSVQTAAGSVAVSKNDRPAAQQAFQGALKSDPDNREALAGLVALDLSQRNFSDAQSRIEKELARRGDDAPLLLMLGRARSVAGDTAGAEVALKRAILVAPSTLEAYALLGQMYFREKRLDQALAEFDRLSARDPKAVGAQTVAAMILQIQNKPEEAKKRYEKVLELNPKAAVAANNLAWMYAESDQSLDIALQLAQTAKSQLPDQPDVNDTLGWIYTKKGLPELAIPILLASIEKNPNNAAYHFHLGVAYSKTGNREKARMSLERAIKLGGDSPEGRDASKLLAALL
jgi:tetratricopeptide (TPR) repeat protein